MDVPDAPPHENAGFRRLFGDDDLSVGLLCPLSTFEGDAPSMDCELALAERAEAAGFDALWVRDVPTYWPKFGEAGQVYDPWVYLAQAAARTDDVALATGSVVLPLRHPLHVATAAASLDRLSGGRLLLGVGSGDRDPEYAAFGVDPDERGALFRDAVSVLRAAWRDPFPELDSRFGTLDGTLDVRPKPTTDALPLLVTGHSRQSLDWIGDHADGWLFYQLPRSTLEGFLADWREATPEPKPFLMGLGVDLARDPAAEMEHVHQGFRAGGAWFRDYFRDLRELGVDHVAVGLRGDRDPGAAIDAFATEVLDRL
ncbi:MAG: TIGR03571 family LLM class oxidoreductase [Haloarculaceae archaeon]